MIERAAKVRVYVSDPDFVWSGDGMEFRLTYEGRLLGASRSNTRAAHKHEIRRSFHAQLRRLWENAGEQAQYNQAFQYGGSRAARDMGRPFPDMKPFKDVYAARYERSGYNCLTLRGPS